MSDINDRSDQIDRLDQNYGEVMVALHAVVARKLREKADACRLDIEALCEIVLMQFWENADFRCASSKLVEQGSKRNLYRPLEAKSVIAIFKTQYFANKSGTENLADLQSLATSPISPRN